jgi:putative GTP pyrophosphokinase
MSRVRIRGLVAGVDRGVEHGRLAAERYRELRPAYEGYASAVRATVERALAAAGVASYRVEHRAKTVESVAAKAARVVDHSDGRLELRYPDPLRQITDLAGVRIITYFKDDLPLVRDLVEREFTLLEPWSLVRKEHGVGYESWHCLVVFAESRSSLVEYAAFRDLVCEVQLRTLLQHAWAEIEHGARYKGGQRLAPEVDHLFISAKLMLDQADQHFDGIRGAQRAADRRARSLTPLDRVRLARLIDEVCGPNDGSISDQGYGLFLERLHKLGIVTVEDLRGLLGRFDVARIVRVMDYPFETRQYRRFEDLLLAAAGDAYLDLFAYAIRTERHDRLRQRHDRLLAAGIHPDPRYRL